MKFTGETLLITGGTGSFGTAFLDRHLNAGAGEIRIFSRDEKKQDDMRKKYQALHPDHIGKIRFYLGDVRDIQSIQPAVDGVDYIFHAAALKQVPSCEFFPMEAVKTNIVGTDNVLQAAVGAEVRTVVCLSTVKAAYPINAMGISKAMMEKVAIARARKLDSASTKICVTRYGNVMYSRGSVIPLFVSQLLRGERLTVTDPNMTRFIMSLADAVELVHFAFTEAQAGDLIVQKAPACTVKTLALAIGELLGIEPEFEYIGLRHGEKHSETLLTQEERVSAQDLGEYFRIPVDARDLNYSSYLEVKDGNIGDIEEFNSDNTEQLGIAETKEKLRSLPEFKEYLAKP